jgi:hypothetical protein
MLPSPTDREVWMHRGVEVVGLRDAGQLLDARRFHFAAVIQVPPAPANFGELVRETQPQARLADAPSERVLADRDAFDRWLGSLDLVPRLVSLGAPS